MSNLLIRPALSSDAENFLRLWEILDNETQFLLFEPGERSTTLDQQQNRLSDAEDSDRVHILTLENQANDADVKLVGMCAARRSELKRDEHNAEIIIAIAQQYVGQGHGFRLLQHMEGWAKDNQVLRLELAVMTDNERALALYKKFGFCIEGKKISAVRLTNKFADLFIMAKHII